MPTVDALDRLRAAAAAQGFSDDRQLGVLLLAFLNENVRLGRDPTDGVRALPRDSVACGPAVAALATRLAAAGLVAECEIFLAKCGQAARLYGEAVRRAAPGGGS